MTLKFTGHDRVVQRRRKAELSTHLWKPDVLSCDADRFAVETRGLCKRFGERLVIDHVDLSVPQGSAFGLLGPNGAGKTTLIRALLGLTRPDSGTMSLLGLPVPDKRELALSRVGALVEQPNFHLHLSGRENLKVISAVRGHASRFRIGTALERVGLAERADEKVKNYSLGMRQRLGVARCLLCDPMLIILDEPANGLDPAGVHELRQMIQALVKLEGCTVFLSSHLLSEVERVCDHVAIVDGGRIVAQGPISDLIAGGSSDQELLIETDDVDRALALLEASELVNSAHRSDRGLRVKVLDGREAAAAVASLLVGAGLSVWRIESPRNTLEERYFELTDSTGDHNRKGNTG